MSEGLQFVSLFAIEAGMLAAWWRLHPTSFWRAHDVVSRFNRNLANVVTFRGARLRRSARANADLASRLRDVGLAGSAERLSALAVRQQIASRAKGKS